MKLLKACIALAILSIGISSVLADTDVVRNSVSTAAGRIDYAMTFDPATAGTSVSTPVINLQTTSSVISAFITGITIDKAKGINSYLLAVSSGGDIAATGMKAQGADVAGSYASVTNYGMYGYVTNNLAYAGQYADEIKGMFVMMRSKSFNNIPASPAPIAAVGTKADYDTYIGTDHLGTPKGPVTPGAAVHNIAEAYGSGGPLGNAVDPNTAAFIATKVYQFAQAGGSKDSTAYPMGIWAQSMNDKGGKLSTSSTALATDAIIEATYGEYKPNQLMNTDAYISRTGPSASISPNAVSMGYADHNIVYANEDSVLAGNALTPTYSSTSTITLGTPHTTNINGGNQPVQSGQNELFVYSIVDKNNPIGKSNVIFW